MKGKQMKKLLTHADKLDRLRAMIEPNQQTWDLSPNDVDAIRLAVEVLTVIEAADDDHDGIVEVFPYDTSGRTNELSIVVGSYYAGQIRGMTAMECFEFAGKSIRGGC